MRSRHTGSATPKHSTTVSDPHIPDQWGPVGRTIWADFRRQTTGVVRPLVVLFMLLAAAVTIQPAAAISRDNVAAALRSTVQVIVPDNDFEMFSLGSGTVMDASGLILTNNHVVTDDTLEELMNEDALAFIAIPPQDLRGEAVIKYYGYVVKHDPDIDLALVQIAGLVDDPEAPLPENLGLPPITIGNSDDLMMSDEINMFGYPGLGGNTPTYTRGTVSGFLDEDRNGVYEWIKTDAELNHGNSGGLATDDQGRFVGVPTAGNTDDTGKIGLVRSGNLAVDFVNSYFPNPNGPGPSVSNVQYAEGINRRGQPVNPAVQFDSGITDLYAVFDYTNFEDGKSLTYVWYTDGQETARDSFAWDGGESGTSWVSTYSDTGMADGFTELELIFDGTSIYRGGVTIGSGPGPGPGPIDPGRASFSAITFAEGVEGDRPVGINSIFSNVQEVLAFFDYQGMTNGVSWTSRWYYEGQVVLETTETWNSGENGSYYISIYHPDGLPPGKFDLELEVEGEVIQTGSFSVQAGDGPEPANEVGVVGVVHDANNDRTLIRDALIVFLNPGVSVSAWVDADFAEDMIHGSASSNRRGEFQLNNTVTPGEYYSIVVVHEDYQPVSVDDWQIPEDTADPYELEVSMDPN